jgi:hypothetical protein
MVEFINSLFVIKKGFTLEDVHYCGWYIRSHLLDLLLESLLCLVEGSRHGECHMGVSTLALNYKLDGLEYNLD